MDERPRVLLNFASSLDGKISVAPQLRKEPFVMSRDREDHRRMREQWFNYRDKAEIEAVRAWCVDNSIEVVD